MLIYGASGGTGTLALEISSNVKQMHAIDISSKMIAIAKRKLEEGEIKNIEFTQTTIYDDRLAEGSYDVILAFGFLHLLEDIPQVLRRIDPLLKTGGLFISSTPCLAEGMTITTKYQFCPLVILSKIGLLPSMKLLKTHELENLIKQDGFQIIDSETMFHTIHVYYAVAKKT